MNSRYRKTLTESLEEVKIRSLYMKGKEKESVEVIAKKLGMSIKDVKKLMGEANTNTDSDDEKSLKIKLDKEKDTDNLERQLIAAQGQIKVLQQKLENEKNKAIKPEPNPDTGEVPLTIGVANAEFTKKKEKEKNGEVKEARWEIEGRIAYRGISNEDDFHMVIDAPSEKAAEAKAEKELEKARNRRKIGPGGGGNIEDFDIEHLERTTSRLSPPQTTYRNSRDLTQEADLSKGQIKKVHKMADELPKKDFKDRYGKEKGDAVRYATATNIVKKKEGIKETPEGFALVSKAKEIAKKHAGNMTKAVAEIEKLQKGLSKNSSVDDALKKANESLDEFTTNQMNALKKSYADMKGKTLSPDKATALSKHLDRIDLTSLKQLAKERIPFLSTLARNKVYRKTGKFEELEEKKLMVKKGDKVREINDFEWRTYSQMGYKLIGKDKDVMKEDRYAGARSLVETIKGLQNKAKKTGMPYSILKKVYDRGMAAWKGGHRPGASQQQWAFARVNSFVTKSSGTWGGADKDLAAKVRGSKK